MKAECFGLKKKDKECRDCGIHRDATQIDPLNSDLSQPELEARQTLCYHVAETSRGFRNDLVPCSCC